MIAVPPDIQELASAVSAVRNGDVVQAVEVVSSTGADPITALADLFNNPNETRSRSSGDSNSSRLEVTDQPEWTPEFEEKFSKLAKMKALGRLRPNQLADFERMSTVRRIVTCPRSGEEIIAEYEQRTLTMDLVAALTKYVDFHKQHSPNRQRKTS